MILVTGSSGTVGAELLKELTAVGETVRGGYHTRPPSVPGVEPVRIDLVTGTGLDEALRGVEAVFLLAGDMDDQTAGEIHVVEAAKRSGVQRLVKLLVLGAETEAFSFARIHRPVERAIEASGITYTFLRPGSFMQNFVKFYGETIRNESAFYLPCGDAREGFVDARDIAHVAARVLIHEGHDGRAYDLLGPEPLTYAEAAARISAAVGRTITYVAMADDEYRHAMSGMGVPDAYMDSLLDLYRFVREGEPPLASSAIHDVTGRNPISFDTFARDHAAVWKT